MARRIIVVNSKGGVGKSTTAVNLSHGLALEGQKVLLIDLDEQASATISLGFQPSNGSYALLIEKKPLEKVVIRARENLDLIPGNDELSMAEAHLTLVEARRHFEEARNSLQDRLEPYLSKYDFVIVDCPPVIGALTLSALTFGREALVPVSLDFLSEVGTKPILDTIAQMRQIGAQIQLRYVVPTFYERNRGRTARILASLHNTLGDWVTEPIRRNTYLAEAPEYGKTAFEYKRASESAGEYQILCKRILDG